MYSNIGTKIGFTERGDAGRDTSWFEKAKNNNTIAGVILITKNVDNENFRKKAITLNTAKPVIVHAGITGWGNTPMEPNVSDYMTTLNGVRALIDAGFPANRVVLRIDPIIPTDEGIRRAAQVIDIAENIINDVKRIRISIYDDYRPAHVEMLRRGLKPIDSSTFWKKELDRRPTTGQIIDVSTMLNRIRQDKSIECCAEPELTCYNSRIKAQGCISKTDLELMGLSYLLTTSINPQNRHGCMCLSCKYELLTKREPCPNNCAYCYWRKL